MVALLQDSGEYPVKDSAQSMHSAQSGRTSDSKSGGLGTSGSGQGSTLRSVLDTMSSGKRMSGQVCGLSRLFLPGQASVLWLGHVLACKADAAN